MTAAELIERLQKYPPETSVMILDGSNGLGCPRDLNFGPIKHTIIGRDEGDSADCEGRTGESIVLIGYGSY